MTDKQEPGRLDDDLIRQALIRDFDSIEAPPAERCWHQIEESLQDELVFNQKKPVSWTRYAALAAAALLLIVLSSIGVMQRTELTSPMVEEEAPAEVVEEKVEEEMEVLDVEVADPPVEEEAREVELFTDEQVLDVMPSFKAPADPSPPSWQKVLNDNILFNQAILLSAGDGPDYHGAIYQGEEEELLWVKSKVKEEDTTSFILNIAEHIQAAPVQMEEINDFIHFKASGQPGLAWHEDDHNQALLVISGPVSLEQLESITGESE